MQRGAVSGVVQRFLAFIDAQSLTGCRVGIAFSGGRDSSALAICAMEARNAGRLAPFSSTSTTEFVRTAPKIGQSSRNRPIGSTRTC